MKIFLQNFFRQNNKNPWPAWWIDVLLKDRKYILLSSKLKNKNFVALGSCDNVHTERKMFEYANWPAKASNKKDWSFQLVWLADQFTHCILHVTSYMLHLTRYILHVASYALQLTHCILRIPSYTMHLASYILHLTFCILHIAFYNLHLTHCILHGASYTLHKSLKSLFQKSLKN